MRDRFDKIVAGMSACLVMVLFAISVAPHAQALDAERRSLLVVELAGANSNADLFALLASLRNTLGSAAFPTSKYTVQPNDTVCSIYRVQSKLPVNSSACPRSAMDLNRALNGKRSSYLRPKEQILIPDIVVESHRQAEIRQSSKGSSSRQKAYRPFTETYLLKIGVTPDIAKQAVEHILKSGMSNVTAYVSDAGLGVTKSLQSANWTSPTSSCLNPASETSQTKDISYFYLFDWLRKDQWPDDSTYDQLKKCALACTESERGSCVDIVLLDAPVSRHSDIEDVVHLLDRDGKETQQSPLAPANACSVDPEFASKDHGTHLARIRKNVQIPPF